MDRTTRIICPMSGSPPNRAPRRWYFRKGLPGFGSCSTWSRCSCWTRWYWENRCSAIHHRRTLPTRYWNSQHWYSKSIRHWHLQEHSPSRCVSSTSWKRLAGNLPMLLDIYVKDESSVDVILDWIEGSQDDVCKTQFSLQFMFTSTTETSIIWFSTDWVGPPMSVVKVAVDEAIIS